LQQKYKNMLSKNQIKWVRSLELKKNRREKGVFVAEGPKVVGDLLRAGYKAHTIFCIREAEYATVDARLVAVTSEELCKLSFLQHPQEVLAVFEIPNSLATVCREPKALCLALDGIQDPGNLGTIIRIADWFGIDTIYCSEDTADCYNPKVVQATMGSLAHVSIVYCDLVELLSRATIPVYGTLLDGDDIYTGQTAGVDARRTSKLTGFVLIKDTTVPFADTPRGRISIVEFVGCTDAELRAVREDKISIEELVRKIGSDLTDYKCDSVL
jgi:TrmH family RNA methyltransferase